MNKQYWLRSLPGVDQILNETSVQQELREHPRKLVLAGIREVLQEYRERILGCQTEEEINKLDLSREAVVKEALQRVKRSRSSSLRPVINATGTVIHTNLGRAPLSSTAREALLGVTSSYSNLELSLERGERDTRQAHVEKLLCELTGAEASLVVNNNAAAVFLVLQTLARGREVIVSRGELVEIGGSFRMPDVMSSSGAYMVEVGTTNKCYISDYESAITEHTAALLKVHTSNYRIMGFTEEAGREELVALGKKAGIPVVEDVGSGVLVNLEDYGLPEEPRVQDCLQEGVSVVTFSGDKLLGGPQAGIILGTREMVERFKHNQLARVLRVDKFTLAALEATLRLYWDEERAVREIPVLKALTREEAELEEQAQGLKRLVENSVSRGEVECRKGESTVGGGALPLAGLATWVVTYLPENVSPLALARRLRLGEPPVVPRVHKDRLLFDVRTLAEGEEKLVAGALACALEEEDKENNIKEKEQGDER